MKSKRLAFIIGGLTLGCALFAFAATRERPVKRTPKNPQKAAERDKTAKWAPAFRAAGEFTNPLVAESSGLSLSHAHKDTLWTLNDSNNPAILYSSGINGQAISQVTVPVPNNDWEDLLIDKSGRLYIADTGDNDHVRSTLEIYCLKEPDPKAKTAEIEHQWSIIPPKNFNCEAFILADDHFYLFNKCESPQTPHLFRFPTSAQSPVRLEDLGALNIPSPITSASLSPDGKHLAVLSQDGLRVFPWTQTAEKTVSQTPKHFPILRKQVEGCVFTPQGILVSTEAGQLIVLTPENYEKQ